MKAWLQSFLKPRAWTVFFSILLVAWQYIYGYRGVDFENLLIIRNYFGFGLSAINWNNFIVRTFSMALIWVFVAGIIFFLLWLAEAYVVGAHNRKVSKNYVNQPKENFAHLLKSQDISLKKHFISMLWLAGFIVLIPVGLFLMSGIVEAIRSNLVIDYLVSAQESGMEIDYNSVSIVTVSFLATLPIWYLYACLDRWCLSKGQADRSEAEIVDNHYAVSVDDSSAVNAEEFDEEDNGSNSSATPVI